MLMLALWIYGLTAENALLHLVKALLANVMFIAMASARLLADTWQVWLDGFNPNRLQRASIIHCGPFIDCYVQCPVH